MALIDNTIKETKTLGENNMRLLPQVRNWCKNILIEDFSAGLIAEMYNLPITLRISCPHTTASFEAMNFEWIAHDFIIENCQNCKFHAEIYTENYGRTIIKNHIEKQENEKKKECEEKLRKQELRREIDTLINKEKNKSETTALSILNLIQQLEDGNQDKHIVSEKILEASKLSPQFFNNAALNFMSLFFDNEDFGQIILESTRIIAEHKKKLPTFLQERLISAIKKNCHLDLAVSVFNVLAKDKKLIDYDSIINIVIDSLWYKRQIGDPYEKQYLYPHSIKMLLEVYDKDKDYFFKLIKKHLEINDKTTRININYLLQTLIEYNYEMVTPHIKSILKSFEFEDNQYEESADRITCITLSKLYSFVPAKVMKGIDECYQNLSKEAQISFIHFYYIILINEELVLKSDKFTNEIIAKLIDILYTQKTNTELNEKIFSIGKEISSKNPELLLNRFDAFIGILINKIDEYKKVIYYISELNKKEVNFSPSLDSFYSQIS